MNPDQLRARTKNMALRVIELVRTLRGGPEAYILGKQMLRSATSVAANYRAAGRARSRAEFVAKISIVVEEVDETLFWLELIEESGLERESDLESLRKEITELLYIFSATRSKARENLKSPNH